MDCFEILEDEVFVDTMCHRVTYKGWNQVTSLLGSALFPNQRDVFHCYCCSSFCESAVHKRQGKARLWTCEQGDQILVPPRQALPVQFVLRVMPLENMAQDGCYDGEQSRHVSTLAGYYWCSQNWLWNQWERKTKGVFSLQMNKCFPCIPSGLGYDVDTFLQFFLHIFTCDIMLRIAFVRATARSQVFDFTVSSEISTFFEVPSKELPTSNINQT
jgi:hypothetical protein